MGPLYHPDREICATVLPALAPTASGQVAACHFAAETPREFSN
jgi:peptide/nickel transport system ATP-binding protein